MFDFFVSGGILPFLPVIILVTVLIIIIASGYVKAPPDVAFIISGLKREPRVLLGRAH